MKRKHYETMTKKKSKRREMQLVQVHHVSEGCDVLYYTDDRLNDLERAGRICMVHANPFVFISRRYIQGCPLRQDLRIKKILTQS